MHALLVPWSTTIPRLAHLVAEKQAQRFHWFSVAEIRIKFTCNQNSLLHFWCICLPLLEGPSVKIMPETLSRSVIQNKSPTTEWTTSVCDTIKSPVTLSSASGRLIVAHSALTNDSASYQVFTLPGYFLSLWLAWSSSSPVSSWCTRTEKRKLPVRAPFASDRCFCVGKWVGTVGWVGLFMQFCDSNHQ